MALFLLILTLSAGLSAQVYEGTAEYDKKKYTAFLAEYDYQAAAVENANFGPREAERLQDAGMAGVGREKRREEGRAMVGSERERAQLM